MLSIAVTLIKTVHFILCIGLIVIVLLQADKGEGLAGAFGGGASGTVFGERGGGDFLSKLTTAMAVLFMITSFTISIYVPRWEKAGSGPVVELSQTDLSGQQLPAQNPVPPEPIPMPQGDVTTDAGTN